MKSNSIFTRQRMGLDNTVWMMLILCVVLSFGLLGYNMINKDKEKPCVETIKIYVGGRIDNEKFPAKAGQSVSFMSPLMSPGDRIVWDFRDETPKAEGNSVSHIFPRKGIYFVVATINGTCDFSKKVVVEESLPVVAGEPSLPTEAIMGNDHAIAGVDVAFTTTLEAKTYEWFLDHIRQPSKFGKDVSFRFNKQQDYVVVLRLDHDKTYRKKVTVSVVVDPNERPAERGGTPIPKPLILPSPHDSMPVVLKEDTKAEPENKKKTTNNENFKIMLQSLACSTINIEVVEEVLCDGLNTKVTANGKSITFGELRAELQAGKKKLFIESVTTLKACKDGVISSFTVEYGFRRKFGILGKMDACN